MDEYERYGPEPDPDGLEEPEENIETQPAAPPQRSRVVAEIIDWTRSILIAVALALIIKATVVQAYMIPTGSMMPTIMPKDRVFGNRFIYHFRHPERGDIIAFKPPPDVSDGKIPFLKRVIAVDGDLIEIHEGAVSVNGKKLTEPYVKNHDFQDLPPTRVPDGMLFVMGDNRINSYDSSKWPDPFLPEKNVQAKAFFRFWPPDRIGTLY